MWFWGEIAVESRSWVGVRFGATSIYTPVTTCLIFFCSRLAVPTQLVACFSFAHQPRRYLTGPFSPTLTLHSFYFWFWAVATRPLTWLQKEQPSHFLLDLILTESQVTFRSPQSISGASQQNSVAVFSRTTQEAWRCKMAPYSSSGVIKSLEAPGSQTSLKRCYYHLIFSAEIFTTDTKVSVV